MCRTSLPVFNERYIRKGKKKTTTTTKKVKRESVKTTQCNTAKLHQPRTNMAAHRHRQALTRHVNNFVDCCSVSRLSNTTLWAPHLVYKELYTMFTFTNVDWGGVRSVSRLSNTGTAQWLEPPHLVYMKGRGNSIHHVYFYKWAWGGDSSVVRAPDS